MKLRVLKLRAGRLIYWPEQSGPNYNTSVAIKSTPPLAHTAYLDRLREMVPPLSRAMPIWIRHGTVNSGPTANTPEAHPCCELGIGFTGSGIEYVGAECALRIPGDILMTGPGVPHWIEPKEYPIRFVTVFFSPLLLLELGPVQDGLAMMRRFTNGSGIAARLVRPSASIAQSLAEKFRAMALEFDVQGFGFQVRLRALLAEVVIELMRLDPSDQIPISHGQPTYEWRGLHRALEFIRSNFQREIYAVEVAEAAELTERQLKNCFEHVLGVSWVQYLQSHRVLIATEMLAEGKANVTEAALAVGFTSLIRF